MATPVMVVTAWAISTPGGAGLAGAAAKVRLPAPGQKQASIKASKNAVEQILFMVITIRCFVAGVKRIPRGVEANRKRKD